MSDKDKTPIEEVPPVNNGDGLGENDDEGGGSGPHGGPPPKPPGE